MELDTLFWCFLSSIVSYFIGVCSYHMYTKCNDTGLKSSSDNVVTPSAIATSSEFNSWGFHYNKANQLKANLITHMSSVILKDSVCLNSKEIIHLLLSEALFKSTDCEDEELSYTRLEGSLDYPNKGSFIAAHVKTGCKLIAKAFGGTFACEGFKDVYKPTEEECGEGGDGYISYECPFKIENLKLDSDSISLLDEINHHVRECNARK